MSSRRIVLIIKSKAKSPDVQLVSLSPFQATLTSTISVSSRNSRATNRNMATDQACLATAIIALAGAVSNIRPVFVLSARTIVLDTFTSRHPFDLSTRSGSVACELLSKPFDDQWDGTVNIFPAFIITLRLRTGKGKRNVMEPNGTTPRTSNILKIDGLNVLTDYTIL